jgi:hypothetical protein
MVAARAERLAENSTVVAPDQIDPPPRENAPDRRWAPSIAARDHAQFQPITAFLRASLA